MQPRFKPFMDAYIHKGNLIIPLVRCPGPPPPLFRPPSFRPELDTIQWPLLPSLALMAEPVEHPKTVELPEQRPEVIQAADQPVLAIPGNSQ